MPEKNIVSIHRSPHISGNPYKPNQENSKFIRELLQLCLEDIVDWSTFLKGKSVLIKPNLVRPLPQKRPATTTDPRVLEALLEILKEAGANSLAVGENPGYGLSADQALQLSGLGPILKKHNVQWIAFDQEEAITLENPYTSVFKQINLPRTIFEYEVFINLPKLKTHLHTLVSLGMKNLIGLLYDAQRMLFHRQDLSDKIVDIASVFNPSLTIIDGIWALEGQAPICGKPVTDMNTIIAGKSMISTDAVATSLMGFNPYEIGMLRIASGRGLGAINSEQIMIVGQQLEEVKRCFVRPVLSSAGCFENILALEAGVCVGCLSAIRHSLDRLEEEGKIPSLPKITLFSGIPMPNVVSLNNLEGEFWCFGNCSHSLIFGQAEPRALAKFVPGCPPHIWDLYKAWCSAYTLK